ncbi:1-(5-phosphoribosyl)-5-[(5-phosphoribosylamino)methylideneamino]imidazole-4-carboxamide isomerase [Marinisporobacter balticus]|uniref:1-(5-phosphoribosyl)-5-[(5-phosphoribosylamino)methylideneamino] imidazole-4-carboxamide isomerase n=1 Tax=Marinisporobacter balticus TaxID=2018667 RepID=A0A4R2L198_9FIRM|nr:1-(5-phosphoribosyl)-5-[(5-phosphoribosylamino)methylideneamino]imidazole-4-carboxamide isomerase [Marinisporobacter balticus]TCO79372.1 1-(5-phosphoribosyl)-5-[(5-phosphoribosylamino)methylideneamino] imidazole-4-carboxamide isomerase [Marinisporobacter balticus]
MIIFPAIDIRGGKCVRLIQGKFDKEDIYGENPVEIAINWEQQGAKYIHLVDLDGALYGKSVNGDVIKKIIQSVNVPVQLGGGIRKIEDVKNMLHLGVSRVILGTSAVKEDGFVENALEDFQEKIAVSIDAKNGYVAIDGWTKTSDMKAIVFAKKLEKIGLKTLIYTDIAKDGMMSGPNFLELKEMKENVNMQIIASGGISNYENIKKLIDLKLYGAIIGKALYTEDIKLEALSNYIG